MNVSSTQAPNVTDNICVVVGELSADVHASAIVSELKKLSKTEYSFWGIAGPHLRECGVEAFLKAEDLAVMGVLEVLKEYTRISKAYHNLVSEITHRRPQCVILFDYPGFNLKLAEDLYETGVTIIYCIPPKIWAHGSGRVATLRDKTDLVLCILPFEEKMLRQSHVNAKFIGNFLRDESKKFLENKVTIPLSKTTKIGLLPGSRRTEISNHLPILLRAFEELRTKLPHQSYVASMPVAESVPLADFKMLVLSHIQRENLKLNIDTDFVFSRGVMKSIEDADYVWVASGTAALEVGLMGIPCSVHYILNPITFWIGKRLIKLPYVNLINICMDKEVVPEFLQENCNVDNLVNHAIKVLSEKDYTEQMKAELNQLQNLFPVGAAQHAAQEIVKCISQLGYLSRDQKFYQRRVLSYL